MRARQRFLKAKSLDATTSYDARFLSGLSDAAALSSWGDQSGNGHAATQSTPANQPTYRVGVFGGQPSVRFDGSDDRLIHTADNNAECLIFAVAQTRSSQAAFRGICAFGPNSSAGTMLLSVASGSTWGVFTNTTRASNTSVADTTPTIFQMEDNGASGGTFYLNELAAGTWAGNTSGQFPKHIGGQNGQSSNVDIGAIWLTPSRSASYRKRIARGLAYSFKISCN